MKISNIPYLLALAYNVLAAGDDKAATDSKVVDLTGENFMDYVNSHDLVLAEFFAPWCGHCKKLAPEFEEAAAYLADTEHDITLAKVDCTESKEFCMELEVQGFPTLFIYDHGDQAGQYQGPRKSADIIKHMLKQSLPVVSELKLAADVESWLEENHEENPVVFLYLGSEEVKEDFELIAKLHRNSLSFISSSDPKLKELYNSDLVVFKLDEEPESLEGEATRESIDKFVVENRFASFEDLGPDNYINYIESGIPMLYAFVGDESARELIKDSLTPYIKQLKGKANVVFLDSNTYGRHASNLNMEQKFPALVIHDTDSNKKYIHDQSVDVSASSIKKFIDDFLGNKIQPNLKSADVPESQDEPVYVLVGSEYDKIVLDDDKDVLVEFYAPWCGHCNNLKPIYDELATLYEDNDKVVIAKLDHTENEVPDKITGYPTIKLFPAGDKKNPITFESARDLKSFIKFIKEKGTHKAEPNSLDAKDDKKKADKKSEKDEL
ncbi:protein disulfide isomerase [Starmerella bacillaris]|uniref:Protein disulfide-isomerase n=1 Tax=Starmerella bacillaris TaxID=1247836 RepID=A0AAV5RIS8_STABA|nr:protein disulfide isomerase [Starmerella bacillaris]